MRVYLTGARPSFDVHATTSLEERFSKTGRNSGNQLIAYGLLNKLSVEEASWEPGFSAGEVNERFDHVVIAAANFLHAQFDFSYLADFLEKITLPITIVGLGAQSNDFRTDVDLLPGTERLLGLLADRCKKLGLRGEYTAELLARRGIQNVQVTGCPSYYASVGEHVPQLLPEMNAQPRLAINASRDVIRHAFDPSAMQLTVTKLMRLAVERDADFIAQTERAEMVIAEGFIPDLSPFFAELRSLFEADIEPDHLEEWAARRCKVFWDVEAWIGAMKEIDFVVGTRFHGAMAALLAGTPALVVCHDTRTTEMCQFLAVPHVTMRTFNSRTLEDLYASIDLQTYHSRRRNLSADYENFLAVNGLKSRTATEI